jgi:UDP-glucose 4-epimerase
VGVLLHKGYDVVILDDLSTGHQGALDALAALKEKGRLLAGIQGDIADTALVSSLAKQYQVEALIHFAAKSLVGESMVKPDHYFIQNTAKSASLFSTLSQCGVKHLIFSSTAAVYGLPDRVPIPEETAARPINPYGESKRMIEQMLHWMEQAYGMRWAALRYFNAAGAHPDGMIGEHHDPETHLIPLILQTALGHREAIHIFGTDYDTPDGTCIRDYIHVLDLAEAHVLALEGLKNGMPSGALNVGTGRGYSVREVVEAARRLTELAIPVVEDTRRAGDPPVLVAKADLLRQRLGWYPRYSSLDTILASAWRWHQWHPNGYQK